MQRPRADAPRQQRAPERLIFDLLTEVDLPDSPMLCILVRRGERVVAVVNAVHGLEGHLHAGWHTEHWTGERQLCLVDGPCGYDGDT